MRGWKPDLSNRQFRKNVYFCFGEKDCWIKALWGFYVYFCIPGQKGRLSKIKGLAEKMYTFVYFCILLHTFHVWSRPVSFEFNELSATDA